MCLRKALSLLGACYLDSRGNNPLTYVDAMIYVLELAVTGVRTWQLACKATGKSCTTFDYTGCAVSKFETNSYRIINRY